MHTEPQESCTDCQKRGVPAKLMYPKMSIEQLETHYARLFELPRGHQDSDLAAYARKLETEIDHRKATAKPKLGNEFCGDLEKIASAVFKVEGNHVAAKLDGYYFSMKVHAEGDGELGRISKLDVCKGESWDGKQRILSYDRGWDGSPLRWTTEQREVGKLVVWFVDRLGS